MLRLQRQRSVAGLTAAGGGPRAGGPERGTQSGGPRCALTGGRWVVLVLTLGYQFNISRSPMRRAPKPLFKGEETKASGTASLHGQPHTVTVVGSG